MSAILSGLTAYVDEQRLPLISKLGLGAPSASEFELMTGVKYKSALNLLAVNGDFGDGLTCGWADSGSTTFTQRNIEVGSIKVQMSICQNAMQKYWMNNQVAVAAGRKNLPFEEEICNKLVEDVNGKVEKGIWQGDKSSSDGNLAKFDGLVKILNATTGTTGGVNVATAATTATTLQKVMAVYNKIPDAALAKSVIYVNYAVFRELVEELVAKNYFHYMPEVDEKMDIILPGTQIHIKGVPGLSGVNEIISLVPEHTFYGCDLAEDKEEFKIWYSEDNDEYRVRIAFVAGVQVAFPSECVQLTWA